MFDPTTTGLWQRSLAERGGSDDAAKSRARLRDALLSFRNRAEILAGEIARDLPDYTVHDVTHLDALWPLADLIAGADLDLTPTEAFVFGGAALVHDLGMGLAAYPDGLAALKREVAWNDTVATLLRSRLGRTPTHEELGNPPVEIERQATQEVLRELHAERAERLALVSWRHRDSDEEYHLIEDVDLRRAFGPLIGLIAHSHWWPVTRLNSAFGVLIGAPAGCPNQWTVDAQKVACLLRIADASHLDASRAPGFLRAIRKPPEGSADHWVFQENLQQPRCEEGRLVYTCARPFPIGEASAWWLCFDTLRGVDNELRHVDTLLTDTGRQRFAARGIAGADDAVRFAEFLRTDGWLPVDTTIKVTDVAALVNKVGGEALYGRELMVPVRELIQNASDAVQARRLFEKRPRNWGEVVVRLGKDGDVHWLEVEDNGIGMSADVLTGPFLDFGVSYWGSPLMRRELPGLMAEGLESTGEYGIGFFSIFMLGDKVRVTTRRADEAQKDTLVLEFNAGLSSRPLLRPATGAEVLTDGGTRVRVWLKHPPDAPEGILSTDRHFQRSLEEECGRLCPSISVNLRVEEAPGSKRLVVSSSDWIDLDGKTFLMRLWGAGDPTLEPYADLAATNLRHLIDASGRVVGRACIFGTLGMPRPVHSLTDFTGVVAVGGLESCRLHQIQGILAGQPTRAARDVAIPIVPPQVLAAWASEQARLAKQTTDNPGVLLDYAAVVRACRGETGDLPVAEGAHGWLRSLDIRRWADPPDEIVIIRYYSLNEHRWRAPSLLLNDNVVATEIYGTYILEGLGGWPPDSSDLLSPWTLVHLIAEEMAYAWSATTEDVLETCVWNAPVPIGRYRGKEVLMTEQTLVLRNPRSPLPVG